MGKVDYYHWRYTPTVQHEKFLYAITLLVGERLFHWNNVTQDVIAVML